MERRPKRNRVSVYDRGVIFRNVDNLRPCRLNDDGFVLSRNGLLRRRFEISGGLRFLTHELNRIQNIGLLILIGGAEGGCPGKVLVHV
jgi:hypothetical protein